MSGSIIFPFAVLIVLLLYFATVRHNLNERQRILIQSYIARRVLYREWLARYGHAARPQIKKFLRCFADSFWVPPEIIHKLGPDDSILEYYHRDYRPGEPDCLETKLFSDLLKRNFKYTPVEEDGKLSMGQLFERITGIEQKPQQCDTRNHRTPSAPVVRGR